MHSFGWFDGSFETLTRRRPTIQASVWHEGMAKPKAFNFVIDTGADHSLLVPDDQRDLKLPDREVKKIEKEPEPVYTLAGPQEFFVLHHCAFLFADFWGHTCFVPNVSLYLTGRTPEKAKKLYSEDEVFPSIIGRDVLMRLALSFCQANDHLFITDELNRYCRRVEAEFPKPEPPDIFDAFRDGN